jgi:hypothetical protein
MDNNDNAINANFVIIGSIACPDGKEAKRWEISIGKKGSAKLPLCTFPIARKNGTKVRLIIGGAEYKTILHRYENSSYIADAYRIMDSHLKDLLQRYGFNKCGRKVRLEFKGVDIRIS